LKISVIQPASYSGEGEYKNLDRALNYIDEAKEMGSKLVLFPELYPGPANPQSNYETFSTLSKKAKEKDIYIIESHLESDRQGHSVTVQIISPKGESVGKYKRTTPESPYIYKDIDAWNFNYVDHDKLPIFEIEGCKVGLLVCSEVYVPELSRILALKGAEIVFYPAGALINELMSTWKIMIQARAIENLMYTCACQNIYGVEKGVAMIAGPEGILAEREDKGVLTTEIDLERMRWLREENEKIEMPKKYKVVPGTLKWKGPDLYRKYLNK